MALWRRDCFLCNKKQMKSKTLEVAFHKFPKDSSNRKLWIKACNLNENNDNVNTLFICSLHFKTSDYVDIRARQYGGKLKLKSCAVPSKKINASQFKLQENCIRFSPKMPSCAAVGCSNSHENDHVMQYFPKDIKRRKEWVINMRRDNWVPTHLSALCEVHFEQNMWEKIREDGKKKLKYNAVPTLFSYSNISTKQKSTIPPGVENKFVDKIGINAIKSINSPEIKNKTIEVVALDAIEQPTSPPTLLLFTTMQNLNDSDNSIITDKNEKSAIFEIFKCRKALRNANTKIKRLDRLIDDLRDKQLPLKGD